MTEDPRIIAPRIPFIDERTGTIAKPWFDWLLSLVSKVNVTELTNIFNYTTAVTQELAQAQGVQTARIVAEMPTVIPQISKREVQDARFIAQLPIPQPKVEQGFVEIPAIQTAELAKRLDGLAIQLAQLNSLVANLASKINETQLQSAMQTKTAPYWTMGVANNVSPTSPNRTITVAVGGTPYYIHAKTTND